MTESDKQPGFTLIELLVVIAIISLLSSVVLASLSGARESAKISAIKQQVGNIERAIVQYEIDNGNWASDEGPGAAPGFVPKYLSSWPEAPACLEYDYNYHTGIGGAGADVGISIYNSNSGNHIAHRCFTERCFADGSRRVAELNEFQCN